MTAGRTSRGGSNYPRPTPLPVRSLFKMEVNDHRGIGIRQRVKNFHDQSLRIPNGRKFGRRSSSIETNAGSDRSPISDGRADVKDNTKRCLELPNIDKKELNLDKEMQELDRKVKHSIDSKYTRNSSSVIFLCGFYCKICQKMIPGIVDDIMAKHGSRENHVILTKPKVEDRGTQSRLQEQTEDDAFDIRFDDDGCLLISKLDDDVENHSNVDMQLSIINDHDSSTTVIDNEKVSSGECAKNDMVDFTDDEDDDDEREEGEAMDDDDDDGEEKEGNSNEFEDISEDREKTPEQSRRRRRYDRTSSRRY